MEIHAVPMYLLKPIPLQILKSPPPSPLPCSPRPGFDKPMENPGNPSYSFPPGIKTSQTSHSSLG